MNFFNLSGQRVRWVLIGFLMTIAALYLFSITMTNIQNNQNNDDEMAIRRGPASLGYSQNTDDLRDRRIDLANDLKTLKKDHKKTEKSLADIRKKIEKLDKEIDKLEDEDEKNDNDRNAKDITKKAEERNELREERRRIQEDLNKETNEIRRITQKINNIDQSIARLEMIQDNQQLQLQQQSFNLFNGGFPTQNSFNFFQIQNDLNIIKNFLLGFRSDIVNNINDINRAPNPGFNLAFPTQNVTPAQLPQQQQQQQLPQTMFPRITINPGTKIISN